MIEHSKGARLRHALSGHEYITFCHIFSCVDSVVDFSIISDIRDLDNFNRSCHDGHKGAALMPKRSRIPGNPKSSFDQEDLRSQQPLERPGPRYTFKVAGATHIRINDYDHAVSQAGGSAPDRSGEIDDPGTIAAAIDLLSELPDKGELFASFTGQIPLTDAFFSVPGEEQELQISFYGQALRALDGSFFAEPSARAKQKALIELLRSSLTPTKIDNPVSGG